MVKMAIPPTASNNLEGVNWDVKKLKKREHASIDTIIRTVERGVCPRWIRKGKPHHLSFFHPFDVI